MVKSRLFSLLGLVLVLAVLGSMLMMATTAFAQDTTPTPTGTPTPSPTPTPTPTRPLTLETDVPSYSDNSGSTFTFDVRIKYGGNDRKTINLSITSPQGWTSTLTYLGKQVSAIDMGPADQFGPDSKTLSVSMSHNPGSLPDPGSYPTTVKATVGDLSAEITLTANVKAKYSMYTAVDSGLLSTQAVAGKDNSFIFKVVNDGSSTLENIALSSTGPTAWRVTFKPDKIESLDAGQTQQVEAIINPPADKTIAGDYNVILTADAKNARSSLTVRVTVLTPSIWGWVGIGIVAVVIGGIMVLFMRLGRR